MTAWGWVAVCLAPSVLFVLVGTIVQFFGPGDDE